MSRQKLFSVTIKDCIVQHYRGSGTGGQKKNKTESAARVIHEESGAVGECEEYREQSRNKQNAFRKMTETEKFKNWMKIEIARCTGELDRIERELDVEMKKVKVEIKDENGRWIDE